MHFFEALTPINGTLGEKYLREFRGIKGELPADFKYNPSMYHFEVKDNLPGIMIPVKDVNGKLIGLNRIFLNKDGSKLKINSKIASKNGDSVKASAKLGKGIAKNGTIDINHGCIPGTTFVSEGTENALTAKEVMPLFDIKSCISVSGLKGIQFTPGTHTVIIIADNDGRHDGTKEQLINAVQQFLERGLQVNIVMPETTSLNEKLDLNDVYKVNGADAVKKILDDRIRIRNYRDLGAKDEPLPVSLNRIREQELNRAVSIDQNRQITEPTPTVKQMQKESGGLER